MCIRDSYIDDPTIIYLIIIIIIVIVVVVVRKLYITLTNTKRAIL